MAVRGGRTSSTGPHVGRRRALEDLHRGGAGGVRRVAGEAVAVAQPGGVAEEQPRGHGPLPGEAPAREGPRAQDRVDVVVQREETLLNGGQRRHGGHRLRDGGGLEEGLGVHGGAGHHVGHTVPLRPVHLEVADDGDAHPGHAEAVHHLRQREDVQPLSVGALDALDEGDVVGGGGLGGQGPGGAGDECRYEEQPRTGFRCASGPCD